MPAERYRRLAYRLLGRSVARTARQNIRLRLALQRAHIPLRPEVYLATSFLNMILAFGAGALIVTLALVLHFTGTFVVPTLLLLFLLPTPVLVATTLYLITFLSPDLAASKRSREIDTKLPYALNYVAIMASAGATPERIFGGLSKQAIYGEVANEAAYIHRDLTLLGRDLITALTAAIDRSPSMKFQDLLQGAVTTLTSGGNLRDYFQAKSQQFMYENRQEQEKFLESLGLLAESYVTVVVAAPLLLIILLSVFMMVGGNPGHMLNVGYILIVGFLPLAMLGFAMSTGAVAREA